VAAIALVAVDALSRRGLKFRVRLSIILSRVLSQPQRLSRTNHGKRLAACLEPVYLRIGAYWYPRGGIPIDVFWQTGTPPAEVWLPDQGVATYRARHCSCAPTR
jgi:hypothetical protein